MIENYRPSPQFLKVSESENDLVYQQDPKLKEFTVKLSNGQELRIFNDGCALVSLYNALKLNGFTESFEEYTNKLANGECLDQTGQISWVELNKLELNLKFHWMQDNEIEKCERVDPDFLKNWIEKPGAVAVAKIQSLYGIERRHFMVIIGVENENLICLESSGKSGRAEERLIPINEVLGVRYFLSPPDSENRVK